MKVYLAGGMSWHNDWRDPIIKRYPDIEFLDPRNSGSHQEKIYTAYDLNCVENCDVLFAYMSPDNPSGFGMSVELGYAYGLEKFIIFVDCSDINRSKLFGMHRVMADVLFKDSFKESRKVTLEKAIEYLGYYHKFVRNGR
jgi:nucleoside 2-deoxyribosyltransferase